MILASRCWRSRNDRNLSALGLDSRGGGTYGLGIIMEVALVGTPASQIGRPSAPARGLSASCESRPAHSRWPGPWSAVHTRCSSGGGGVPWQPNDDRLPAAPAHNPLIISMTRLLSF